MNKKDQMSAEELRIEIAKARGIKYRIVELLEGRG